MQAIHKKVRGFNVAVKLDTNRAYNRLRYALNQGHEKIRF